MSFVKRAVFLLASLMALHLSPAQVEAQSGFADVTSAAMAELNAIRAQHGRAAIVPNPKLGQMAMAHAQDMTQNNFFSHVSSNGGKIKQRSRKAKYRYCAINENLAKGSGSIGEVMNQWMGSPGHRKNLLSKKIREFGLVRGPDKLWVMVMGRRC